jgi:hypothetical protein
VNFRVLSAQDAQAVGAPAPANTGNYFAIAVEVEIVGESLNKMQWDLAGNLLTQEQMLNGLPSEEAQRLWNTDGFVEDTPPWNWNSHLTVNDTNEGIIHLVDQQVLLLGAVNMPGGNGQLAETCLVTETSRTLKIETRLANNQSALMSGTWGFTWSNANLLWTVNDTPPRPNQNGYLALLGANRTGIFSDIFGINDADLIEDLNP